MLKLSPDPATPDDILNLTAKIVSAHLAHNRVDSTDVPPLITVVYQTLRDIGSMPLIEVEAPQPMVPIKRSVFPDHIVCLEDGKKLKMLKRHLKTAYNMTPEEYRDRWGLPADYPMVAPNYATTRSRLAKQSGLGRGRGRPAKDRVTLVGATSDA